MHLLLRRAGGTEHALLALLAAPSIFAVVLSTNAAHGFVALARSCSRAHILTVLFRVLLPSLVADHRGQHQAVAAATTTPERLVAAVPLRLQQLLLQLAHVLLPAPTEHRAAARLLHAADAPPTRLRRASAASAASAFSAASHASDAPPTPPTASDASDASDGFRSLRWSSGTMPTGGGTDAGARNHRRRRRCHPRHEACRSS